MRAAPILLALAIASSAGAQPAQRSAAPVSAQPQQTTATFGDWILRCVFPPGSAKACEAMQVVQQDGKPVAQLAIGSAGRGKPTFLTVLVPPSVSFGKRPAVSGPGSEGEVVALAWQRCLPGGCVATAELSDATLMRMRGWAEPARIGFADGGGRAVEVPFSPTGLPAALDGLAKENTN